MSSRSGQANESGSVHRRGVAAFLAAHGLAGRGVPGLGHATSGPFPVALAFETDNPTDDLTCELSDGTRAYVSAKRRCGKDHALRDTVDQWKGQVGALNDGDRLVLAVAEPVGPVRHLGAALDRRRSGAGGWAAGEKQALEALKPLLAGLEDGVRQRLLEAARLLIVQAAKPGDAQFERAADLLDNTVVPAGQGPRAVRVLGELVHTEAGSALRSGVEVWIEALSEAGVAVFTDREGAPGARARAFVEAVRGYRERLSAQDGKIDLSLLADDLLPLVDPSLADRLRAGPEGGRVGSETTLLLLARRWPRMLLVGLPGAGKSTAVSQLAARWAADPGAPVPVPVDLGAVASHARRAGNVTLGLLCELAARDAPVSERAALAEALEANCRAGTATLLLDGLDEATARKTVVADGLAAVIEGLHPETGVLVTTRPNGITVARRLGFPVASLLEPRGLEESLERLLTHVAEARPPADRDTWLADRLGWLARLREQHRDLTSVPLLATLLTLVAADDTGDGLPRGRMDLLLIAVTDSVKRWERARPGLERDDPHGRPTDGQLLDGFAELGHLLAVTPAASRKDARAALARLLASRWDASQGDAQELGEAVLWFWDDHMGVFVIDRQGALRARSRVFVEVGEAMWAHKQADDVLSDWAMAAVGDDDRRGGLLLAAGLDDRVVAALLQHAEAGGVSHGPTIAVAADAVLDGAGGADLRVLLRLLAGLPQDHRSHAEGAVGQDLSERALIPPRPEVPAWHLVERLARLPLPSDLRRERRTVLQSLPLAADERTIAGALVVLTEADVDGQELDRDGTNAVRQLLDLQLPVDPEPAIRHESRRHIEIRSGSPPLAGHTFAASLAVRHLGSLPDSAPARLHTILLRSRFDEYGSAQADLARRGHVFGGGFLGPALDGLRRVAEALPDDRWAPLFAAAAALDDAGTEIGPSLAQLWRMPDLCDLFVVLGIKEGSLRGVAAAVNDDTDATRRAWVRAAVHAAELDPCQVSAQARHALALMAMDRKLVRDLPTVSPPAPLPKTDPARLDADDRAALAAALAATSETIADSAQDLLLGLTDPAVSRLVMAGLPDLPPSRRRLAAFVACACSDDPVGHAAELLAGQDPPVRAGAARLLKIVRHPDESASAALDEVRADADLTVRLAAGGAVGEGATGWSCTDCTRRNDLEARDCRHCDRGTRPGP